VFLEVEVEFRSIRDSERNTSARQKN